MYVCMYVRTYTRVYISELKKHPLGWKRSKYDVGNV